MRTDLVKRLEALEATAPAGQPFVVFTPEPMNDGDLAAVLKARGMTTRRQVLAFHWLPVQ